eukprot:m.36015 g.36015  ORF g.36015 m.36015 type:complete len:247 (-) comp15888_c0_seq2:105-845(-)
MMIENCNDQNPFRATADECPFNFFRSSGDNSPSFNTAISNLLYTQPFLDVARPGCFAYPDMLELGAPAYPLSEETNCLPHRLTVEEARGEFAAWCVVSSPLILGFDLGNMTEYDTWFPIISNPRALAINQAWYGSAGRLVAMSSTNHSAVIPQGCLCEVKNNGSLPAWTVWGKPMGKGKLAVVALNSAETSQSFSVSAVELGFSATAKVATTDVWTGQPAGPAFTGTWKISGLPSHGHLFYLLQEE